MPSRPAHPKTAAPPAQLDTHGRHCEAAPGHGGAQVGFLPRTTVSVKDDSEETRAAEGHSGAAEKRE